MSRRPQSKNRQQIRTVLIMGEGYAERAWLQYLKSIYHERHCGCSIKLDNAYGKGAAHVINEAISKQKRSGYDLVAAFFDTDKDWGAEIKSKAEKNAIALFANTPCLEAELLRLASRADVGITAEAKMRFEKEFGANALKVTYANHFPKILLDRLLGSDPSFTRLVTLIQTGACK